MIDLRKLLECFETHRRNFGPVKSMTNTDWIWLIQDYLEYTGEDE